MADTNPTNALSYFRISALSNAAPWTIHFSSSSNRQYTLSSATNLIGQGPGTVWTEVTGQVNVPGSGNSQTLTDPNPTSPQKLYRVRVRVP